MILKCAGIILLFTALICLMNFALRPNRNIIISDEELDGKTDIETNYNDETLVTYIDGNSVIQVNPDDGLCPTSPSFPHAACKYVVTFDNTRCGDIREEIVERIKENQDRKSSKGKYELSKDESSMTAASRTSGPGTGEYTDKFILTYHNLRTENDDKFKNKGCKVTACSFSQSTSVGDFSTNYCNMRNLYCGKDDGCNTLKHNLGKFQENISTLQCMMHDPTACDR